MTDEEPVPNSETGVTPREALSKLAPSSDDPKVGAVLGVRSLVMHPEELGEKDTVRQEVTVYYTDRPPKEQLYIIEREDDHWRAEFQSSRRV